MSLTNLSSEELVENLRIAYNTLNEIPNTRLRSSEFKDSYEVASKLGSILRSIDQEEGR